MSDSDSGRESPVANSRPRTAYHHPKLLDNDRNTKLHYVAAQNDVSSVEAYLKKESRLVDPQNYLGWTPLMMACRQGHFEMVKCLLKHRANATMKNKFGMNVFQLAIASGNLEMVQYLLDHFLVGGVSRRILEQNLPVASLAVLFRHQSILKFLISKHFAINDATIGTGITPFMFAHAMENNPAITTLLKHKVDTTIKNYLGHTAVDIATIRNQIKMIHSVDPTVLNRKLAAQESIQNEMQNQQLRNVLQLAPPANSTSPSVISSHQVPYILVSPYPIMTHVRKSSNVSPYPVPPAPQVTPITPAFLPHIRSSHQVFFPPDFSPFTVTSPVNDLLNARINSSADMFFSPPVMNFLSPCM